MRRCFALSFLLLVACTSPAALKEIQATRIAKVNTTPGTSKVLGSLNLPAFFLSGTATDSVRLPRTKVRLLDEQNQPLEGMPTVETDDDGIFTFPEAPVGKSMIVEANYTENGHNYVLRKYLHPTDSLTCAKVDLATTLFAYKLLSQNPLASPDPGLQGAELFELVDPTKLEGVEESLRKAINQRPMAFYQSLATAIGQWGNTQASAVGVLFDQLTGGSTALTDSYQQVFERPDASLEIKLHSVGHNSAPGDWSKGQLVLGIMKLSVDGAAADTARIEYWMGGKKILETLPAEAAVLDTWKYPNGPYTLETVAVKSNGRRETLSKSYLIIRNTFETHCLL